MLIDEYVKMEADLAEARRSFDTKNVAPLFAAVVKDPRILMIKWKQGTPAFNDGEPCMFGVNEVNVAVAERFTAQYLEDQQYESINEIDMDDYDYSLASDLRGLATPTEKKPDCRKGEPYYADLAPALEKLAGFMSCEALCEQIFGDNQEISVVWNTEKDEVEFQLEECYDY